jgi:hypothetical protein
MGVQDVPMVLPTAHLVQEVVLAMVAAVVAAVVILHRLVALNPLKMIPSKRKKPLS